MIINKIYLIACTLYLFTSCNQPEILLLCEKKNSKDELNQVYLIKNIPQKEDELFSLLNNFNRDFQLSNSVGDRTFLKNHKNNIIDIVLGEEIDYSIEKCKEIDNMDIVLIVSKLKLYHGGDTIIYNYFK